MENKVIQQIAIEKLTCRPQVRERFDEESLAGLAQTLKETGILQPLLVRRDGSEFVVLEGERRLRAAKMAGLTELPVIIDDRELGDAEVVYRQFVVNCSRKDLGPMEKARAIDRLMRTAQLSASQVAVKLGMSPGTVCKLLALLSLPESVQAQVEAGRLPLTTAYALTQAKDAASQQSLAEQAATGALTREDVAKRAKSHRRGRRAAARRRRNSSARDRVNFALGNGRSVAVAGPGLMLAPVIDWLSGLLERLRRAQSQDVDLPEAVKRLASDS